MGGLLAINSVYLVSVTLAECHAGIAERHAGSMHRLSSFNNPAYRFSIEDTRAAILARDGDVWATRLCAARHDQVPLFSDRALGSWSAPMFTHNLPRGRRHLS